MYKKNNKFGRGACAFFTKFKFSLFPVVKTTNFYSIPINKTQWHKISIQIVHTRPHWRIVKMWKQPSIAIVFPRGTCVFYFVCVWMNREISLFFLLINYESLFVCFFAMLLVVSMLTFFSFFVQITKGTDGIDDVCWSWGFCISGRWKLLQMDRHDYGAWGHSLPGTKI